MKEIISEPFSRFDPLNDYLFFKVFGEKGDEKQLIGFLNAVLGRTGKKPIKTVDINEKKNFIADIKDGKSCSLDVMAVLENGTRINIEVQIKNENNMDRRTLFYFSKIYSETLKKGEDYLELPDVVTINIVGFNFPPDGDFHTCYHLREDKDKSVILTEALEIHFINMAKWRILKGKDLVNEPLHRWLTWFDTRSSQELLEEVLKMDSAIMDAKERQDFVMQDEEDSDLYWRRRKALLDWNSGINGARREGRAEGLEEGLEQGLEQGQKNEKFQIARNALAEGSTPEFVQKITGLDLEVIKELQN